MPRATSPKPIEGTNASKIVSNVATLSVGGHLPNIRPDQAVTVAVPGYDGPHDFLEMRQVAEILAGADVFPRHCHNKISNIFAIMMQARAANIPTWTALQHMNVIDGRADESAELVRAILLSRGFHFRVVESTDEHATVEIARPGASEVNRVTYTIAHARQAGLADKRNWKLTPAAMLVARATTRAAGWYAPDATMGLCNLSNGDLGADVPGPVAHLRPLEVDESPAIRAAEILAQALETTEHKKVVALGIAAKNEGLLFAPVEGTTLRAALYERMAELAPDRPAIEAGEADTEDGPLECGCDPVAVLEDGTHRDGCDRA